MIGQATANWRGALGTQDPRSVFEELDKNARDRIRADFDYRLPEIREIWNDPSSQMSPPARIVRDLGRLMRYVFRKSVEEVTETTMSQADAAVYLQGIESLESHRRFPGSNRIPPSPRQWRYVDWKPYDYGGSLNNNVDFLYWIDHTIVRPPDVFINK